MPNIIRKLFGTEPPPQTDPDPLPGRGGYAIPEGPAGQTGFPGSTSSTRHFKGASPRVAKLRADTHVGWEGQVSDVLQTRQASYRGDVENAAEDGPRSTPDVDTPQPLAAYYLQNNSQAEFFGGPELKTGPGNDTAGGNILVPGPSGVRNTETPMTRRQPQISVGVPGSNNVRNTRALRHLSPPGQPHGYQSASRGDQRTHAEPVTVQNRYVFQGGGVQTWWMERQMPYTSVGDGSRGASLNGQRYYATGAPQFLEGGMGSYGLSRASGPRHRPTNFQEPAPWSANYYDTTQQAGYETPGEAGQVPNMIYTSPEPGRATNSTGRTG